jgi:hypothetical protein
MSNYKLIQLTNNTIGSIPANAFLPVGLVTRRINAPISSNVTFQIASSTSDTVYLNEPGSYKITYVGSFAAGAAGDFSISLIANGTEVFTSQETVAAADDYVNITIDYVVRVCPNCCSVPATCPTSIQFQVGNVETSATVFSNANMIIEKIA